MLSADSSNKPSGNSGQPARRTPTEPTRNHLDPSLFGNDQPQLTHKPSTSRGIVKDTALDETTQVTTMINSKTPDNHRVDQRADPPRGQRPRPLPDRASRPDVRLPRPDEPRPHRHRAQTLVQPLEEGVERLRDHLRRTPVRRTASSKINKVNRDQLVTPKN
jgi:hypothetical protein